MPPIATRTPHPPAKNSSTPARRPQARLARRLDLRLAEDEKSEIDQAAALTGSTTSAFVRQAILRAARETIRDHTTIRLTAEDGRRFVAAINGPPEPNENLRALVQEFGGDRKR
jgi:uncharacterized protein (DUF1778 family)